MGEEYRQWKFIGVLLQKKEKYVTVSKTACNWQKLLIS